MNLIRRIVIACLVLTMTLPLTAWPGKKQQPQPPATLQQKAVHMVHFKSGQCTAAAVGPHAILTAVHCADGEEPEVMLDLSRFKYNVVATVQDNRDHAILLLDGPAFTNYIQLNGNTRSPLHMEEVYMWGDGEEQYPPRRLDGIQMTFDENSDVDQAAHIQKFTLHVLHGDSGAPVYGQDGKIVALITYLHDGDTAVGFELDFTAKVEDQVYTFTGELPKDSNDGSGTTTNQQPPQ